MSAMYSLSVSVQCGLGLKEVESSNKILTPSEEQLIMLIPIQSPPKIRKGKSSTAKISSRMTGLMPSQFMEGIEESMEGMEESMEGMED